MVQIKQAGSESRLFHGVDDLLGAAGCECLKFLRLIGLHFAGHLTRFFLQLGQFRLQRGDFAVVARFHSFVRVKIVAHKLGVRLHKRVYFRLAKRRKIVAKRTAGNEAAHRHKGDNQTKISQGVVEFFHVSLAGT
jgi:hypothetical protein